MAGTQGQGLVVGLAVGFEGLIDGLNDSVILLLFHDMQESGKCIEGGKNICSFSSRGIFQLNSIKYKII